MDVRETDDEEFEAKRFESSTSCRCGWNCINNGLSNWKWEQSGLENSGEVGIGWLDGSTGGREGRERGGDHLPALVNNASYKKPQPTAYDATSANDPVSCAGKGCVCARPRESGRVAACDSVSGNAMEGAGAVGAGWGICTTEAMIMNEERTKTDTGRLEEGKGLNRSLSEGERKEQKPNYHTKWEKNRRRDHRRIGRRGRKHPQPSPVQHRAVRSSPSGTTLCDAYPLSIPSRPSLSHTPLAPSPYHAHQQ
ncbi:hypothetical protein C7212DRAFT_343759 [Tuber magnatum]|uniref:Uncharacterized protein n=1 Tax=Tuber magnatum TaxID=42249 RepID=A0A317SUE7_9PEZI|nr:hypothetical protein C7212DRAFT_343759 [Tuber magnatum]